MTNSIDKKMIIIWGYIGFISISIMGSMFHFVFEWLNGWRPLALIAAVNESTWEHLKLAFWPAFFFYLVEYLFLHKRSNNFILAKTISLSIMPLSIILFFYLYLVLIGHDILFLDIAIFVIAIGIGQLVSYVFLTFKRLAPSFEIVSLIFLIILTLAFSLFTYFPPHIFLFKDPITGGYGIVN